MERVGFREIFDGALGERAPEGARPGRTSSSARASTSRSPSQGVTRRLRVERLEPCPACAGSGEVATAPVACGKCRGSGQVRGRRGHMIFSRPCAACGGAGTQRRRACDRCEGEGRVPGSEEIEVQIPPGARDGSVVRLRGLRPRGPARGRARGPAPAHRHRVPPALPPRGRRSRDHRSRQHRGGRPGRSRGGGDAGRAGDHRAAGGHPGRAPVPPPQARHAAAGPGGPRRSLRGGAGERPHRDRRRGPRPSCAPSPSGIPSRARSCGTALEETR